LIQRRYSNQFYADLQKYMGFTVTLNASGHQFLVDPQETLLDAALRQSIGLPYGCRNGQCGSCAARLVSGAVCYPDGEPPALAEAAAGSCICCKAVPTADLELQVREAETAAEIEPRILPVRVVRIDHLADDVIRLYLKLPESQRLQFLAGQYLDFLLSDGERRAFSIANAPHDDELIELHIRHVDGGRFTDWAFSKMAEKAILRIHAPLGTFTLDEDSERPLIFMGGGTGFAPLKGQIEHAFHLGIERPIDLYWGVRARSDLYLPELPERWMETHRNFRFVPVLSEPGADWTGRTGWVHEAVLTDHPDLSVFDLYMAGPPPMIAAAREAFTEAGLPPERLFYDSFEYGATAASGTDST
jgi:CDP-4-dehydro-6-deoxyglucose reductase